MPTPAEEFWIELLNRKPTDASDPVNPHYFALIPAGEIAGTFDIFQQRSQPGLRLGVGEGNNRGMRKEGLFLFHLCKAAMTFQLRIAICDDGNFSVGCEQPELAHWIEYDFLPCPSTWTRIVWSGP